MIDTVGDPILMDVALKVLAPRGRIAYISGPKTGSTKFTFDMKRLYREEQEIVGCNSVKHPAEELARQLNNWTESFESGNLTVAADDQYEEIGIDGAVEAYKQLKNKSKKKFVITFP